MKMLLAQEIMDIHIQHWRGQIVSAGVALRQCVKQRLSFLEVGRVKSFGEPVIDRGEQVMSFLAFPLLLPEASQAGSGS